MLIIKTIHRFLFAFIITFLFFLSSKSFAVTRTWDGGGGVDTNWSNPLNWSGDTVPLSTDDVLFDGTSTNNSTIDSGFAGTVRFFTINAGYIGTITQAIDLTINQTFHQEDGTFAQAVGSRNIDLNSGFSLEGGTFNAPSGNFSIFEAFTYQTGGTFNHNNGTVILDGNGQQLMTFDGSASCSGGTNCIDFYNFTGNKSFNEFLISTGSTVNVYNHLLLTNTSFYNQGGGYTGTLNARSTLTVSVFGGGSGNLSITTSATRTILIDPDVGGTGVPRITWNAANATLNTTGVGQIIFGGFNLQTGTVTLGSQDYTFSSAYTQSGGTLTGGAGTYTFSSTFALSSGNCNLSASSQNVSIGNSFTLSGGTFTPGSGTYTITGAYSQTNGTFAAGAGSIDLNSTFSLTGGTFNAPSGNFSILAGFTYQTAGTFNPQTSTIILDGTGQQLINLDSASTCSTGTSCVDFYNFTIDKSSNEIALTTGTSINVLHDMNFAQGFYNQLGGYAGSLNVQRNITVASGWNGGTAALYLTGSQNQLFNLTGATGQFNGPITVNKTVGTVSLSSALVMDAASQNFTLTSGTFDLNGNNLTVSGAGATFTVDSGGNLQLQGGETITGTPTLNNGSTVTYNGTSSYTLKNYSYRKLVINGSGGVFTPPTSLSIPETLTITTGTLDLAGNNLSVTSTFSNNGTLRLEGAETVTLTAGMDTDSGTVNYNGAATYASLAAGNNYYNLTFSGIGSWTHIAALDVNNNLTISAGTLNSSGNDIVLTGNWSNSGTYTSGSNTVTLDGANQTLFGSTTFNHFNKTISSAATLTLPASATNTFAGTLTLLGASGNLLSLRSSTTGSQTFINPQSSRNIQWVDVKDNNNTNLVEIDCSTSNCTNSGNNTNWKFSGGGGGGSVTISAVDGTSVTVNATEGATVVLNSSTDISDPSYSWMISSTSTGDLSTAGSLSDTTSPTTIYHIQANAPTQQVVITLSVTPSTSENRPINADRSATTASVTINITNDSQLSPVTGVAGGGCSLNFSTNQNTKRIWTNFLSLFTILCPIFFALIFLSFLKKFPPLKKGDEGGFSAKN